MECLGVTFTATRQHFLSAICKALSMYSKHTFPKVLHQLTRTINHDNVINTQLAMDQCEVIKAAPCTTCSGHACQLNGFGNWGIVIVNGFYHCTDSASFEPPFPYMGKKKGQCWLLILCNMSLNQLKQG